MDDACHKCGNLRRHCSCLNFYRNIKLSFKAPKGGKYRVCFMDGTKEDMYLEPLEVYASHKPIKEYFETE